MLNGVQPGKSGGVHYTAYINTGGINTGESQWYFFNDIGPIWEKLDKFPKNILKEKGGIKPELYFYAQV